MNELPAVLRIISPCVFMKVVVAHTTSSSHIPSPYVLYFSRRCRAGVDIDTRHFLQLI
jgi:hypothetical protein